MPEAVHEAGLGQCAGPDADTAQKAGLRDGGRVRISRGGKAIEATVIVQKGHADGVASLTLGYGRWNAGPIGSKLGANGFALREAASPWVFAGVKLEKVPRKAARRLQPRSSSIPAPKNSFPS